ncbi:hypothetical protein FNV43_RR05357 [Rhamnella rubrinervis]|uniref:Uncharacterized protein n=1 Tax=Rhamnella rubrinervis TaxID=2594499 RepID=A0A8K0MR10_9ROSA|nr:hypothetical protein FNV43_RR05357 [Rhamnella rubrinervis]
MVHSPSSRNNRLLEDMSIWKPPQAGWIKANIDAGFNDGQAALAFVTKDNMGRLLFAATKLMPTRILTWQSYWVWIGHLVMLPHTIGRMCCEIVTLRKWSRRF